MITAYHFYLILLVPYSSWVAIYHCRSERPSAEEVEGSESGSKEIKVDDKKNVEDKVEAADSRPVRYPLLEDT